ncbi:MAG TPA: glycogen synthase GlgA [Methylomirabilota bacterium]|jgi:starch synthase|nr:glycogen synthase GlgA [Methylomirabilota bacterium]
MRPPERGPVREPLRILYVTAEAAPFARTGGLGDVAAALPAALAALGHDVRVVLPEHRGAAAAAPGPLTVAVPRISVPIGDRLVDGALHETRLGDTVPVYLVAQDGYYDRPALYGAADDCERYVFFCRSVLAALPGLGWLPQVVHANDWPAGLVPVYLETLYRDAPWYADVATVFTIHNLAYQGLFWHYDLPMTGLGWDLFTPAGIEFFGHLSFLKGGLVFSDLLTTVSPGYAREIQTPAFGERMDGILRERSADLVGILNGLDVVAWNPATDPDLPKRYDRDDLSGKAACTAALRDELGLPDPGGRAAVVGVVTRLAEQKGVDLVAAAVPVLEAARAQLVVLGTGDERYERLLSELAAARPATVAVRLGFDDRLARRIYAGADLFLMPSRYEPCGLGQLIALRYGTVPVVRRTGGLADTVQPWNPASGEGTGFLFDEASADACNAAVARALAAHADVAGWRRLVANGMAADFSWTASADAYVTCYRKAIRKARRHA